MTQSLWTVAVACVVGALVGTGCDDGEPASHPEVSDADGGGADHDASHILRDAAMALSDGGIVLPAGEPCTNEACTRANGDSAAICRKDQERCVALLSPECPQVDGPFRDDGAVVVPVLDEDETWSVAMFAADEINQLGPGLPGESGRPRRPLVLLRCPYDAADDATREAILDHLLDELALPGMLAPSSSDALIAVSQRTVPAGMFILSDRSTAPAVTHLDDDGLVWRIAPSHALTVPALALAVADIEAVRRSAGFTGAMRVALVTSEALFALQTQEALVARLRVNDHLALDPANEASFEIIRYADHADGISLGDFEAIAARVLAHEPHIVIAIGSGESTGIALALEAMWTQTEYRPEYVFNAGNSDTFWLPQIGAELAARIRGSYIPGEAPDFATFRLRYEQSVGPLPSAAGMTYDAVYAFAYASAAAFAQGPVTGRALADGMAKLASSGPLIGVGPGEDSSNVQRALSRLAGGDGIDLQGVSGKLDFDLETGEPSAESTPVAIWCIGSEDGRLQYVDAAQRYDATTDTLVGTFSCPREDENAQGADAGAGP